MMMLKSKMISFFSKKMSMHLTLYFFLVFFIPSCSKTIWLFSEDGETVITLRIILYILFSSVTVFISDIIQILFWLILNKIFNFSMRKIIVVYIYNKLLLPISGIFVLIKKNVSFSLLNMIYMLVFTLLSFLFFEYRKTSIKILCIILIILMMLISFIYVFQIFY
jgi:hypothetical protein